MKLQRILAKDSRSAHEQAIARYGREVLVVSNSRVNGMTELIVAVDVEPEPTPRPADPQAAGAPFGSLLQEQLQAQAAAPAPEPSAAAGAIQPAATMLAQRQAQATPGWSIAAPEPNPVAAATSATYRAAPVVRPLAGVPVLSHYRLPDFLAPTRPAAAAGPESEAGERRARELVAIIREEIAHLRREVHLGQQLRAAVTDGPAQVWIDRMTDMGMSSGLRTLLMAGRLASGSVEQLGQGVREMMRANLPPARPLALEPGVHMVCGPAGSGKTTMAARLAGLAAQSLGAQRVALVSWRDCRPGAWAQIQLLAAQLGVDVFRAADAATLSMLRADFDPSRVVIVDDGQSRPEQPGDLDRSPPIEHHLVMPADASSLTLRQWSAGAAPAWRSLSLSRLDQGVQPWPILEVAAASGLVIAGGSRGPGLADMDPGFDAERLLDLALEPLGVGDAGSPRPAAAVPTRPARPARASKRAGPGKAPAAVPCKLAGQVTVKVAGKAAGKVASPGGGKTASRAAGRAAGKAAAHPVSAAAAEDHGPSAGVAAPIAASRRTAAQVATAEAHHA